MKKTKQLNIKINRDLKRKAEHILMLLGITPSSAVHMLYSQIALFDKLPLYLMPENNMESYNKEQFNIRIDADLKDNAERKLKALDISPSSVVQSLYAMIVSTNSFPLDLKLPDYMSEITILIPRFYSLLPSCLTLYISSDC